MPNEVIRITRQRCQPLCYHPETWTVVTTGSLQGRKGGESEDELVLRKA